MINAESYMRKIRTRSVRRNIPHWCPNCRTSWTSTEFLNGRCLRCNSPLTELKATA